MASEKYNIKWARWAKKQMPLPIETRNMEGNMEGTSQEKKMLQHFTNVYLQLCSIFRSFSASPVLNRN